MSILFTDLYANAHTQMFVALICSFLKKRKSTVETKKKGSHLSNFPARLRTLHS